MPNDFHCYHKSDEFLSAQNEAELSRHIYYKSGLLLQIEANITNRRTEHVYSGRVIFIEIEDHNYEFLNKQFLQYREGQRPWKRLLPE